ncbi:diacylglycerol kinase family protein [Qipengyuania sediminis]|uniref:diacylglycerol kinase family protein n=1 Tax=Qipengyuania sediminis TaxID=1532023 RepID=UPI00140541F5|nr:diacylglycerol kinase family protein [Qipengyuania sediminis]
MDRFESAWLIVNAASGSNSEESCAAVRAHLDGHGIAVARVVSVPDDPLPDAAALDSAGTGLVVIYTGDGTLRSALTRLQGWGGAVLVLPGGTTNLLSKALHGDRPVEEIMGDLPCMTRRRRKALTSSAGLAVIEVVAGPGAKWSDVREGMRAGDVGAVASTAVEAAQASAGGSTVVLADPGIGKPEGYPGIRLSPTAEGIEVEGYGAETITEYLAQGIALLRRDFRSGPHDDLGLHPTVRCVSNDGTPIELMLDGERECGSAEMQFSLAELAVDLLTSADG